MRINSDVLLIFLLPSVVYSQSGAQLLFSQKSLQNNTYGREKIYCKVSEPPRQSACQPFSARFSLELLPSFLFFIECIALHLQLEDIHQPAAVGIADHIPECDIIIDIVGDFSEDWRTAEGEK
ncbi:MAG: hypothetical protein D3922_00430 [Candidatus Electrothrix sp. AR1]|nr:hypothetical protein [Candidatus Electrothrix sp. AR1]